MANKIIHKHSSVVTDGQAKLPTIDQLDYGELAVNYADGVETISMKNSENEIVEFKSKEYFEEIIKENEFVTAAALTELNEKLKEYEWEGEKTLAETITDLEQTIEDNGLVTSAALNTLNKRVAAIEESGSGAIAEKLANIEKDIEDNEYVVATALSDLDVRIDENELITASALTQLNEKIKSLEDGNVGGLEDRLVSIETMVENNSLVAATALTALDERTTYTERKIASLTSIDAKIDKRITAIDELITANEESNKEDKLVITSALTDLNDRVDTLTSSTNQSLVDSVESYVVDTPKVLISLKKYNEITPEELSLKEGDTLTLDCTTKHVEAPSYAYPFHINIGGEHIICKTTDGEYMTKYNYGALTGHHTFMYKDKCFVLIADDIEGYPQINHGTNDTLFALTPNRFHIWDTVPTLTLSLKKPTLGVSNEYIFQFTSIADGTNLTLPYNVQWVNDTPPTITGGMTYQISIVNGLATAFEYAKKEPNNNEIWYISETDLDVTPSSSGFNANIISNTYENGMGVIVFDNDLSLIGDEAFMETDLTSIIIPNRVTSIGENALSWSSYLTDITIPNSVTSIGDWAFEYCEKLTEITIPDSVTSIGENAFANCVILSSVYCKATTPPTGADGMFSGNADGRKIYVPIASVDAYKSAEYWSDYADYIEGFDFPTSNIIIHYTSKNGIITPYSSTAFGANIVSSTYQNDMGVITFDGNVTSIGDYAFLNCYRLTSITIPDSVTSIGDKAFQNCDFTEITIPGRVISIGASAFAGNNNLASITIPDSVTSIGEKSFSNCSKLTNFNGKPDLISNNTFIALAPASNVTTYTIPDGVTSIGKYAFQSCDNLTSITIPDSVTSIGDYALSYCPYLTSIDLSDGVTKIGYSAFSDCYRLTSITIPDSVTSIGDWALYSCSNLTSVNLSNNITSINTGLLNECPKLTSIIIPDSVTTIGSEAFSYCEALTEITIPDSVTEIGSYVFSDCSSLVSVYCKPITPPTGADGMFSGNADGRKIYVPMSSVDAYKAAAGWSDYADAIEGYNF